MVPVSFQWLPMTRTKTMKTKTQEILCEHQETFLYCEGDQAQTQGAQRDCGISILWDISNPSGHGPALCGLTWTMVLDKVFSKGPFQPQLLLFHEKVWKYVHWSCSPQVLSVALSLHQGLGMSIISTSCTSYRNKTSRALNPLNSSTQQISFRLITV